MGICQIQGARFRVQGLGCEVQGARLRLLEYNMSVLVESFFYWFGCFCTFTGPYASSTLLLGNGCWEKVWSPAVVVDIIARFRSDNRLGLTLSALLNSAERVFGLVIQGLIVFYCMDLERIKGRLMFTISWWRSRSGFHCQNGQESGIYANLFWSSGFIFVVDAMLAWCTLFVSCCGLMLLLLLGCHCYLLLFVCFLLWFDVATGVTLFATYYCLFVSCCGLLLVFICLLLSLGYLFMLVVFEANCCHST
jgi:hypothetical protein